MSALYKSTKIPRISLFRHSYMDFCGIVSACRTLTCVTTLWQFHHVLCSHITKQLILQDQSRQKLNSFTELLLTWKRSSICMMCKQSISIPKEYNLRWHFEIEHLDFNHKYSGKFGKQKIEFLVQALKEYLKKKILVP
jgi:hypothetical protein